MVAVTISNNFGAQENKICHCFHFFPFCLPLSERTGCPHMNHQHASLCLAMGLALLLAAAPCRCSPVLRGLGCSFSGLALTLHTSLWPTLLSPAPFYSINYRSSPGLSCWEQVSLGHDLHCVLHARVFCKHFTSHDLR